MIKTIKKYLLESKNFQVLSILVGLLPLVLFGIYTYFIIYKNGTEAALIRRKDLGKSVAKLAEERFDYLILEGIHFVSHPKFQKLVKEKKWEMALASLVEEQKPINSDITRLVLFETDSTAKVGYPYLPDFENVKDKKFVDRDWYQGVSRNWEPYVSEIFKRATEPRIYTVSVVIPIKSILPEENGKILGILNLSISIDIFYSWSKLLNTEKHSVLYFMDQKGQTIGHLKYMQDEEIIKYINDPYVQKLLYGEEGVHIIYNPTDKQEKVSAYFKIGKYNWGVVLTQDTAEAFRERDNQLKQLMFFGIFIFIISSGVFYLIFRLFFLVDKYQYQEKVLLESIGDGVFVVDKKFKIILWNKAANIITGLLPQDVIGKKYYDVLKFIHAKTHRDKNCLIQESIRKGEIKHLDSNTLMMLNNGRKIPIGDSAAPIFSEKGRVDGAIIVFRDRTQEYNLNQAKDEFLSIAAHQLRTPLGIIRWNIEMLLHGKMGYQTKEAQKNLEDIYKNNLNLIKLVNDLLDVSRINQNKVVNNLQLTDVLPLLKTVIKEKEKEIKVKNIDLIVQKTEEKIPKIKVDPNLFIQVLRNLLSNAIKYNRKKGFIKVEIAKKDNDLLLIIKDNGIGIPKKQQKKVFNKFSRADNAVSLGIAGTGLGLFVIKSYLDLWQGKIWLESEEGKGTVIYVKIPYEKNTRHRRQ